MRCTVLLASSALLALCTLILIGCGGSGSGSTGGGGTPTTNQMGSYTVNLTTNLISYTPPTTLTTPVTSVSATFTATAASATAGAPTPIYVSFVPSQTNPVTYTLDISAQSPLFTSADKGTYTFTVVAGLADNSNVTIAGTPSTVTLNGGTNTNGGPPGPPPGF